MPELMRALAFFGLLVASGLTLAATPILQVDLLLLEQPSWVRSKDVSSWPVRPQEVLAAANPEDLANRGGFSWRPGPASSFADVAEKLGSQGYKTLLLTSYRFPQTRLRDATSVSIRQGEPLVIEAALPHQADAMGDGGWFDQPMDRNPEVLPPINGWVRSWVDTYLFVEFDLARYLARPALRQQIEEARQQEALSTSSSELVTSSRFSGPAFGSTPSSGTETNPVAANPTFATSAWSQADIWPREAVEMHRISERKRVRLNEIHYFDHPQIGILVRVTEPASANTGE